MKKTFSLIAVVTLLLTPFAAAGSVYDSCNPCDMVGCKPKASLWEFGGWVEGGIYGNEYGQENAYAGGQLDGNSGNTALLQNVRQSDFQMNQLWVYGQKKLSKRGFDVGGRVDFGFGTDMVYLQSENLEYHYKNANDRWQNGDYYTAIPQVYGEIGYDNLSVKVGKILSPLGHESIMAPDRFFYSLSYAYGVNPKTLTGAIATWDVNRKLFVFGGWVSGENRTFEYEKDNAFVGGVKWRPGKRLSVAYGLVVGREEPWRGWEYINNNREYFVHSLVVNFKPNKRWDYTFEWTLRNENDTYPGEAWYWGAYGINSELIYNFNERWSFGARFEWMHVYSNSEISSSLPNVRGEDDALALTLGLNWKPNDRFMLRPEVRYDVLDNNTPFNRTESSWTDNKDSQWSFGISGVVKF